MAGRGRPKKDKKRVTFYLKPETDENLKKMAKFLGVPKSDLLDDLVSDATNSFLRIIENKDGITTAAMLEVIADKIKELSNELKSIKTK
jgi:hypothetical protein